MLANVSCEVLTLMPAIFAYSAVFPPSSLAADDDRQMAETKTALALWNFYLVISNCC